MRRALPLLAVLVLVAPLAGCTRPSVPALTAPGGTQGAEEVACPPGLERCREVTGRVAYVERVDPDGDGDLHVVVLAGDVTAPGLTAVDVSAALRPAADPRAGAVVTAAGQVQTGSYGQSQVHAEDFRVLDGR